MFGKLSTETDLAAIRSTSGTLPQIITKLETRSMRLVDTIDTFKDFCKCMETLGCTRLRNVQAKTNRVCLDMPYAFHHKYS